MRGFGGDLLAERDAVGKRRQIVVVLQRVSGGDHPPELVEAEALDRRFGDQHMSLMRRIERAAEQADHHAAFDMGHAQIAAVHFAGRHVRA